MNQIINFINEHYEWLFGGIGVTVVVGIFSVIKNVFFSKQNQKSITQFQKSGDHSTNTQIGEINEKS